MKELGYRDNRADRGTFRSAADWGKNIYRNWFSGNGKYANKLTDASTHKIEEIKEDWDKYLAGLQGIGQDSTEIPSNGKSFYKAFMGKFSFWNNGKGKNKQASVQTDSSIGKPVPKEFYGELIKEELPRLSPEYAFEDRVSFEEELLELAPEYAFEDKVPLEEEILELVQETKPTKSRRKYADKYVLNEDMKNSLKGEDTETLAKYFMSIEGVGYKTAAKLLGEAGRNADEKQLRKWYRGLDKKSLKGRGECYETTDDLYQKYSLELDKKAAEIKPIDSELLMFENGVAEGHGLMSEELKNAIKSQSVEKMAKELMCIKEIEYKDVPKELREFYKELGMEIDIPDSKIHEWYREMRREHVKEGKWQIYDTFDKLAETFVGIGEFPKETRGYWVRNKRKSLLYKGLNLLSEKFKELQTSGRKKAIGGAIAGLAGAAIALVYTGTLAPDYSNVQKAEPVRIVEQQKADYFQEAVKNLPAEVKDFAKAIYTVKKGDTLSQIVMNQLNLRGKEIYKRVDRVTEKNKIADKDTIFPGQKIDLSD